LNPLDQLKAATTWMWSLGDYTEVAPLLEPCAIKLADECAIEPGAAVLDVAAGNGNFALAAAARGAKVLATDLTPRMLELGRARTEAAGVDIEWREGDAEALPVPDASFDVVASVFGAMFALRPEVVAREMFRVCREGGVVAMANYSWTGFLGDYAKLLSRYSRPAPVPLPAPFEWGDPEVVRQRFAGLASDLELRPETLTMRFASPDVRLAFWERTNGPTIALRSMLPPERYAEFRADAVELMGGSILKTAYLVVLARKRIT
jgi:2-polyprenyl-6-hydroxyphenyl methylase/3-demethylubiquinone-9 3-methyltransferase